MINTPHEVIEITKGMALKKYNTTFGKLVILGILAGFYIGMGGVLSSLAGAGVGGIAETNPILPKLISGATFPLGLMLIILVGGELFTGNNANLIPATIQGEIPKTYFLKNWIIIFISNFIGLIIFDYIFVYHSGIMQSEPYASYITKLAEYKTHLPWHQVFIRGIGANWLVCLAVWLGLSSQTMLGRLAGLWWPVMAFVVMGFEHSIANMFYIPTGIFHGANVTWTAFFVDNLIPATLGNIVGGAIFVGGVYGFLYGSKKK
ncbi:MULTISPECIES: formate/nitrite transporter family protein [Capnocytophaga]|uniref:Formate transporter n=1 Tax=Capnocytophaga canis TaxID=1848903 RepID=A0A0B7IL04_9FLAO|nr:MULTISPECIES: formate/nitrite transporter family protein [Capnocytophaga]ATA75818.1 formate transporter [Capnocytophaga sp. H2931]RIY36607.1 formate transporter [Capnocytophaga canis]CEN42718.1 putative formate transporter [Capnocytophaga canis]CEN46679.1 putative formate transporter [Capnocytophaga canis]CEN50672.1 putative formate transporter [Capnocytophaga canis]